MLESALLHFCVYQIICSFRFILKFRVRFVMKIICAVEIVASTLSSCNLAISNLTILVIANDVLYHRLVVE